MLLYHCNATRQWRAGYLALRMILDIEWLWPYSSFRGDDVTLTLLPLCTSDLMGIPSEEWAQKRKLDSSISCMQMYDRDQWFVRLSRKDQWGIHRMHLIWCPRMGQGMNWCDCWLARPVLAENPRELSCDLPYWDVISGMRSVGQVSHDQVDQVSSKMNCWVVQINIVIWCRAIDVLIGWWAHWRQQSFQHSFACGVELEKILIEQLLSIIHAGELEGFCCCGSGFCCTWASKCD